MLRFNPSNGASLRFSWGNEGSLIVEAADANKVLQHPDGTLAPSYRLIEDQTASVSIGKLTVVLVTDVVNATRRAGEVSLRLVDRELAPRKHPPSVAAAIADERRRRSEIPDKQFEVMRQSAIEAEDSTMPLACGATVGMLPAPKLEPIYAQEPASQRVRESVRQHRRISTGMLLALFVFLLLAVPPRFRNTGQMSENPSFGSSPTASASGSPTIPTSPQQSRSEEPPDPTFFEPVEAPDSAADGTETSEDAEAYERRAIAGNEPSSPAGAGARTDAFPESTAATDPRLALARQLLEREDVITPPDRNAVDVLSELLYDDPENTEALRLMQRCADTLVTDAQRALFRGDEFTARNLVEEVLAFHPTHGDANELWRRLTDSPGP